MKRLGVAAIVHDLGYNILLGRRGKDPNRGLFVLPGGGVEDGESLEEALKRELLEETGIEIEPTVGFSRWERPTVIELPDRIVLVAKAYVLNGNSIPKDGSDLYDVGWFDFMKLPADISPVVYPVLQMCGYHKENAK
jgi:ADP-ribose pyrophosphatase YjhB (NUDIX family)